MVWYIRKEIWMKIVYFLLIKGWKWHLTRCDSIYNKISIIPSLLFIYLFIFMYVSLNFSHSIYFSHFIYLYLSYVSLWLNILELVWWYWLETCGCAPPRSLRFDYIQRQFRWNNLASSKKKCISLFFFHSLNTHNHIN